jgi:TonB-dependent receptor
MKFPKTVFLKNTLSGSIAIAFLGSVSQSWAQEAASAASTASEDATPIEEVVVFGIRSSLRDAIDIKRSYVGTVDAISAEDFGKFPDGNLAESLARVPGIGIDRSNVEGQAIAVRGFGPEFNLVTLNGRQMPTAPGVWSGGRSYNFGDIASPGIAAVEVFKSANSRLPSGGIGATVNMLTTKPLNVDGTKISLSAGLVADTTSEDSDLPLEIAALFATNQDRWGFSISGSFQERTNREEGTRESNWITVEDMAALEGYNRVTCCWADGGTNVVDNNQRADGKTFYQEPTAYLIKDNNRERINAQAAFQFAISDALTATVDYTYSRVDFDAEGVLFGSWLGGWDTVSGTINENGAYTDVVAGNRAYDHELLWNSTKNENKSLGFNFDWQINDSLGLVLDAHSSSAAVDGGDDSTVLSNTIGFTTDIQSNITHTNGGGSGINTFSYDADFGPENYLATGATIRDGFKENQMDQIQLTGEWINHDGGLITSVEFGISHIENDYQKISYTGSYGAQDPAAADYDDGLFNRTSLGNFMNSFNPDIGTDYYYVIDPVDALAAFAAANPGVTDPSDGTVCCGAGEIDSNERVYETLDSAYLHLNMTTDVKGMPLDIVMGLRYDKSDTESISYYPIPTTLRWDMIGGLIGVNDGSGAADLPRYGSNSMVLPSVAISLGLTEDQVLRLSVSETMARPDLFDLSSRLDIGNRDYFQPTANGGNPDLDPLTSKNFDISYENYYGEESYFAVNYFIKEIDNFIGSRTVGGQEINGLTDPTQSAIGQFAQACVQEWVEAGRPDTGFPPGGSGYCVSQQALWAQGWMNDQQHMGWVALGMAAGLDVSNGYPALDPGVGEVPAIVPPECGDAGWWRCGPGYLDGTAGDPVAMFEVTAPYNMNSGRVSGFEVVLQHLFEGTSFGMQFNYTYINGGDVDIDRNALGEQFILPGLGDSGNFSVFYEDEKHTARLALNYRGETVAGFGNYEQPLYVEARNQIDFSYQFRLNESTTFFLDAANINDEETRLYARHSEMLFLSQDHGPVYKFGARMNF